MKRGYLGSIVLGLNDALIELTGTLAGLTLALQNSRIIAVAGLITGIAASLSMASSEYLSTKAETTFRKGRKRNPGIAALYTGLAYFITVLFLIFPFLILGNVYYALIFTLINSQVLIGVFNYFTSFEKGTSFIHRYLEMASISLGIALVAFIIGHFIRIYFGINV